MQLQAKPWYRQLWFWLLISPMLTLIVSVPIMLTTAFKGADDRVIDDYYKEGRMINNHFESLTLAVDLNIGGNLHVDWQTGEVWFVANQPLADDALALNFSHPAKVEFDFAVELRSVDNTRYRGDLPSMQKGRWYMSLQGAYLGAPWRIASEWDLSQMVSIALVAKPH